MQMARLLVEAMEVQLPWKADCLNSLSPSTLLASVTSAGNVRPASCMEFRFRAHLSTLYELETRNARDMQCLANVNSCMAFYDHRVLRDGYVALGTKNVHRVNEHWVQYLVHHGQWLQHLLAALRQVKGRVVAEREVL